MTPTAEIVAEGVLFTHDCDALCGDGVRRLLPARSYVLDLAPGRWRIEQREPLTLKPSVQCRACGLHGYVTAGQWQGV